MGLNNEFSYPLLCFQKSCINNRHKKKNIYFAEKQLVDYQKYALFVRELFPQAERVLDVGIGFGQSSMELKNQGFVVTSMDKVDIGVSTLLGINNIDFIHDAFSLSTDVSNFDLVVGLHCCSAAEFIIKKCIEDNVNFIITLCEIHNGLSRGTIKSRREYIDYLKSISSNIKETVAPIYSDKSSDTWRETVYYKKPF